MGENSVWNFGRLSRNWLLVGRGPRNHERHGKNAGAEDHTDQNSECGRRPPDGLSRRGDNGDFGFWRRSRIGQELMAVGLAKLRLVVVWLVTLGTTLHKN